jgi:undecaprenyl-diphosphatase
MRLLSLVVDGDHRIIRRVSRWNPPRPVRAGVLWATYAGNGWLWCLLGAAILAFGGDLRLAAFGAGVTAAVAAVSLFRILKPMAARARPCALYVHCWAELLPPDQFSFPSGHSMTAFAICVPLGLFYPALLAGLLLCAASVAASRVLLGMHFLSDVVAGSALGAILGVGAHAVFA